MNETNKPSKKKLFVLLGILVIAIALVVVASLSGQKGQNNGGNGAGNENQPAIEDASSTPDASAVLEDIKPAEVSESQPLKDVKIVVPGANPVTADNKVVTETGQVTDNSAAPMSANAPKQTGFLVKEELPQGMTNITITSKGMSPASFTTKVGAPTSISVTSGDDSVHVFSFSDPSLSAVTVLVGPGQTKAIVFNAPATAGEYEYKDAAPDRTASGKMIVK